MRSGLMRRSLAAASATVMAGAALVVGGAGVASAAPATATHNISGNLVTSSFSVERTLSEATPTYGDVVTMRTQVERTSLAHLLYRVRDFTPECMEYVPGTARWQASGGDVASEATAPGEFSRTANHVQFSHGGGVRATPFWMTAEYTVLCNAGQINSGGTWIKRALLGNDELGNADMGPQMTVLRKGTSVFLHEPVNPQVSQQVTLRAVTSYVPDGARVDFTVDGTSVGMGTVTNGEATIPWTPSTAGSKLVRATFAQTGTHGASTSQERTVTVSPTNQDSSVEVNAAGSPQVGKSTRISANVNPPGAGGTAEFLVDNSVIGAVPVQADGTAALNWIPQTPGEHTIDVNFSGRAGVNPSTGALGLTVSEADPGAEATSTSLATIPTTATGEQVALTATVTPQNASGSVAFYDGQTLIGTATVVNGVATYEWTPDTEGSRTIRAEFTPSGNFLASQATTQAVITPQAFDEEPAPEPEPSDPVASGSLGALTGSLGS